MCVLSARDEVDDRVRAPCRTARTTTSSSRSRSRRSPRGCTRCCAAVPRAPARLLRAGDLRLDPRGRTRAPRRPRPGAHRPRVRPARAAHAPPRRGARPRRGCTRRSGATRSTRGRTSPTSSSATCGASSRPAASRACCTPCAGSGSSCEPDRRMRSLRGRLTLGVVLVLAAVLTAAGVLVSRYVDSSERDALDDRLERTAQLSEATALDAVQDGLPENDHRLDAALRRHARRRCASSSAPTVAARHGRAAPRGARACASGCRRSSRGGERYRAYVDDAARPRPRGPRPARGRLRPRRRSRAARRTSTAGCSGSARSRWLLAAAGTWLAADLVAAARAAAAPRRVEHRRRRGPRPARPGRRRAGGAALARRELQRDARAARPLDAPTASARSHATRRFAADAGHELRTPLTSVQATLDALRRHPELPDERRAAMLDDAATEQRRMVDLLDGLQALARGDAPGAERPTVDLAEVVDAAVVAAAARHPRRRRRGRAARDAGRPSAAGSRACACSSTTSSRTRPATDAPTAAGARDARRRRRCCTSTTTARASRRPSAARIFEPFARIDGTGAPGSGLGLALVDQQARHHGVRVAVGDAPLGGARFTVSFSLL